MVPAHVADVSPPAKVATALSGKNAHRDDGRYGVLHTVVGLFRVSQKIALPPDG